MSKPRWVKKLAEKRIRRLFEQAKKEFEDNPERSRRYMELAHNISEKYNKTIPKGFKKRFCPDCYNYWVPGETVKVRIDSKNSRMIYECFKCKEKRTYGYNEE